MLYSKIIRNDVAVGSAEFLVDNEMSTTSYNETHFMLTPVLIKGHNEILKYDNETKKYIELVFA